MNTDQTYNLIQKIVVLASGSFIAKGVGDKSLWEIVAAAVAALLTWYISHKWNASPAVAAVVDAISKTEALSPAQGWQGMQPPTKSGHIRFAALLCLAALSATLFCFLVGCAHIQPGNDPLVVNVERAETMAKTSFDQVLAIDNSQRAFYASNAPAFHQFCEKLRQPQSVADITSTNGAFVTLPRCSAMLLSLDNVKLEYKAGRAGSNEVNTVLLTVTGALSEATTWLNKGVATNSTPKTP